MLSTLKKSVKERMIGLLEKNILFLNKSKKYFVKT